MRKVQHSPWPCEILLEVRLGKNRPKLSIYDNATILCASGIQLHFLQVFLSFSMA